ncbi:hypothetical protein [Micromonospora sp. C41]|uniref:hypothetical protein n=1 Tax=Micromonospora sp. C41 TaxID=2824878 RepID=UPI001B37B7E6|nr:hypothetical protein [Micromonospora sp. C41]MBQ1061375.1 hypothetical protein [Micromonospora sp. C41]
MDPLVTPAAATAVLGNASSLLKAVASAIPPVQRRSRANREERRAAYLAFQRASMDSMTWAQHMLGLEVAVATRLQMVQMQPTLVRELGSARACTATMLGALSEIRMVGNPAPRKVAEEVATLIGHLYETMPVGRPARHHQWALAQADSRPELADLMRKSAYLSYRLNSLRAAQTRWRQRSAEFEECLRALGIAQRDFVLAARDDLGQGRRWWQRSRTERKRWYQFWRPCPWPGGWPGPDAQELIARVRVGQ